jgi:hypothetical protein|tara:strand:+ start:393 stop:977 length:585 start_codon:yes stop_codon:yes gene_type:complete
MAIQTVNIGTTADDGAGDPLRTAFDKINDNFSELYAVSGAGSGNNIAFSGNKIISEDSSGDITLDPNGTGKVIVATAAKLRFTDHVDNAIGHVDASGDMKFDSNLSFDGTTLALNGTMTVGSQLQFTDNRISTTNSNENIDLVPNGTGTVNFAVPSQTTVGSAGSASAPPARPTTYLKIRVHGTEFAIPAYAVS